MKNFIIILSVLLTFSIISCSPDSIEIPITELPESVEIGTSILYLNGEMADYDFRTYHDTVNNQIGFVFMKEFPNQDYTNKLQFVFLPLKNGDYIIHRTRELYLGAFSTFGQSRYEARGWEYELLDPEDGFFEISSIDKEEQIVQGKFRSRYKLKDKNGFRDTGLPETILFEGIFHENYIRN